MSVFQTLSDKRTAPGNKGSKPRERLCPGQRSARSCPPPPRSAEGPAANSSSKRSFRLPTPAAGGLWLPGQVGRKAYPRSTSCNRAEGTETWRARPRCPGACTDSANMGHDFERLGSHPNPRRGQQAPAADQHTATTELGPQDALRPSPGMEEGWHRMGRMCAREVPREHRDGHAGVWKNHLPEDQSPRREQRMLPEGPEHEGIGHGAVCLQRLSEPLRPPRNKLGHGSELTELHNHEDQM